MPPHLRYHTLITQVKKPEQLRKEIVDWYFTHGENASATAREVQNQTANRYQVGKSLFRRRSGRIKG